MGGRVERRPDARIVRSAIDEVKSIQALLADVYKDAGDGRTLLRELVQNADDAEADRLVFAVFEDGWPGVGNTLLRGPSLVTVNNGPFKRAHQDALHQAVGGSKAGDAGKVGRFGIGLKSVFHLCEALVYVGAEDGVLRPGALNPWAGTGDAGDADPIHPDWDGVGDDDLGRLLGIARELLGSFENGLLQWVPLRRRDHLDRGQDSQYGLGQMCPSFGDVIAWFDRPEPLGLLLAQCGHLASIEASHSATACDLEGRRRVARIHRPGFSTLDWVGRHDDDREEQRRAFEGRIDNEKGSAWHVTGVDALGHPALRQIRDLPEWPRDPHWHGGRTTWLPRKALGHAAVTVLRPTGALGGAEVPSPGGPSSCPSRMRPSVPTRMRWLSSKGQHPGKRVRGLDGPLVVFALRDRVTGSGGAVRKIVVGLLQTSQGEWKLLRDWELIKLLNPLADKPRSVLFDAQPDGAVDVTSLLSKAESNLRLRLPSMELPFQVPAVESLACLLPGQTKE